MFAREAFRKASSFFDTPVSRFFFDAVHPSRSGHPPQFSQAYTVEEDEEPLMDNKLAGLINLVKHMPEKCLDQAIETLEKMKGEAEKEEEQKPSDCPHCHAGRTVRNGHRHGK
jgi:hypothetical protein